MSGERVLSLYRATCHDVCLTETAEGWSKCPYCWRYADEVVVRAAELWWDHLDWHSPSRWYLQCAACRAEEWP